MIKKFFIHPNDKYQKTVWVESAQRLGIKTTPIKTPDSIFVPLTEQVAFLAAEEGTHTSLQSLKTLIDNIDSQMLPLKVVPAKLATSEAKIRAFGNVPLFVKRRMTTGKDRSGFAYTKWSGPDELIAAGILNETKDERRGEYVVQPLIEYPLKELSIYIATNEECEIKVFWTHDNVSLTPDKRYLCTSPAETIPDALLNSIQQICKILGVKNSIHFIDFVWYNDEWHLSDWNPRPASGFEKSLYWFDFIPDTALAHIFGISASETPIYYSEQRSYWEAELTKEQLIIARKHGLVPRYNDKKCNKLVGHGSSKEEVQMKFSLYESELNETST